MVKLLACLLCIDEENKFTVVYDQVGTVLMEEHFKDKHPDEFEIINNR